jgi:hypothetical protein
LPPVRSLGCAALFSAAFRFFAFFLDGIGVGSV